MTIVRQKNIQNLMNARGFTLLEVLIALLVLSIGLLGLAALQTTGLRSNEMASMRTQATQLAYDISDRMRANPEGVENQFYPIALGDTPATPAADPCTTIVDSIDRSECIADTDLDEWRKAVTGKDSSGNPVNQKGLPGGQSQIVRSVDATGIILHTITVHWNEARDPSITGTNCPPVDNTDLRCFSLVFSE
jgi:type IV pilus assembly protein PilV